MKPRNPEEEQRFYRRLATLVERRVRFIEESDADPETKGYAILELYMRLIKNQREAGAREALGGRLVGEADLEEAFEALDRENDTLRRELDEMTGEGD